MGRMRRDRVAVLLAVVEDSGKVCLASADGTDVGVICDVVVGNVEEPRVAYVDLSVEGKADVVVSVAVGVAFEPDGVVLDCKGGAGETGGDKGK